MNRHSNQHRQRGASLIDVAITLAVVSVLVGSALPEFDKIRQRRHLEGTASQLETDFHLARSQAVAMNKTVRLSFGGAGNAACYAIHTGQAGDCDCSAAPQAMCTNGAQLIGTRRLEGALPVAIASNSDSVAFSADFGTATPTATVRVLNAAGEEIQVVVNVMGRVRSCSPTATLKALQAVC